MEVITDSRKINVIVMGSRGWLGELLVSHLKTIPWIRRVDPLDVRFNYTVDIRDAISSFNPNVVINCAGRAGGPTGENIDYCEEWKEETWGANVVGPLALKNLCDYYDVKMVHLGSGCIFSEGKDLTEETTPTPNSFYGETKALCDEILMKSPGRAPLILRLRMPIHKYPNPRNIIDKVLRYDKVLDIPNSMTYVPTLLSAITHLIKKNEAGIFNVANEGTYSAWDIVKLYAELYPEQTLNNVVPVTMSTLVKLKKVKTGRSNCTLNTDKLKATGFQPQKLDLKEIVEYHGRNFGVTNDGLQY